MNIGKRIREARETKGLSQEELAHKLGYAHRSTVTEWEKDGSSLRPDKIEKIAQALGCDPAYLTGWTNNFSSQNNNGVIGIGATQNNTTINNVFADEDVKTLVEIFTKLDKKSKTRLLAKAYELDEAFKKN